MVELDAADALEPGGDLGRPRRVRRSAPRRGGLRRPRPRGPGRERASRTSPTSPRTGPSSRRISDVPRLPEGRGRAAGGVDEAALRCENAGLLGRISVRQLRVPRHRVEPQEPALATGPARCASCASSTSCRLAALRRRHATRESWKLRKLWLVLTTRCNLDCAYCYTRRYSGTSRRRTASASSSRGATREPRVASRQRAVAPRRVRHDHQERRRPGLEGSWSISNGWNWPDERIARFVALPKARLATLEGKSRRSTTRSRGPGSHAALLGIERVRARKRDFPDLGDRRAASNVNELEEIAEWAISELRLEALRIDRVAPERQRRGQRGVSPADTRRYIEAGRKVSARFRGASRRSRTASPPRGCPLYVLRGRDLPRPPGLRRRHRPHVRLPPPRPAARLGMATLDVADLLEKRNCTRAKLLVDEEGRPRQIERKDLLTCVECLVDGTRSTARAAGLPRCRASRSSPRSARGGHSRPRSAHPSRRGPW